MSNKNVLILAFIACSTLVTIVELPANAKGKSNTQHAPPAQTISLNGATATVAFSPNGDAQQLIVDTIDHAKRKILVQAYSFTSMPIITALGRAHDRGTDVRVILDKTNDTSRYSGTTYLQHHSIPVWIDDTVAIAHSKVIVIDDDTVITGSFNFTTSAQTHNAENVIVIHGNKDLANLY